MSETKITPVPQRRNANRHTQRGMQALEASIATDGWIGAITVAADGETFDGSARVEKTAENGMLDEAIVIHSDGQRPIVVVRDDIPTATDPRAVRLGISANRIASLNLEWEPDILAGIAESGFDLSSLFTADEWADVTMPAQEEHEADEPVIVDETKPTRCQLGDVWRIGRHTVACLDSTDRANVERLIVGQTVGMVVADPPYGIDLETDFTETTGRTNDYTTLSGRARTLCAYAPIAGDDSPFIRSSVAIEAKEEFWFGADYYVDTLDDYGKGGAWLVWDKRQEGALDEMRGNNFELCWSKVKHKRELIRITWIGVLGHNRADDGDQKAHPSQKPVKLFRWLYERYGSAGDLIFDPFLGSGPSLKAAEASRRTVVGCELSAAYIDHIIEWGEAHGLECERVDD